jgi:PTS hybrid protein
VQVDRSNGFVSLVLVSHSEGIAAGVAELVGQVAGPEVPILAVGGAGDGALGTDAARVLEALRSGTDHAGSVVLMDIGSSVLAVRAALAELDHDERERVFVADAPLVEGAIAAGVSASTGASPKDVASAAEEARHIPKL